MKRFWGVDKESHNEMISFEIIENADEIKEYYAQWDKLFNRGAHEPSVSLEWFQALMKSHLEGFSAFFIILKEAAEIIGIVPIYIKEIKKSGISIRTLFPASEHFNTHSDFLLKNCSKEIIEVLMQALFSLKYKWDVFRTNRFDENHPILNQIAFSLKHNFDYAFGIQRAEPSFYIPLEKNYNEFLKKRSSNFRYKLKSVARKINSIGEVIYLKNNDFHDFSEAFDIIQSIEENSWKHRNGTGITSNEKQRKFYRELFSSEFKKGRLRFCFLCLNKEPIAYEAGLIIGKKYYGVHGSYIEQFKTENPGTVLLAKFIEDLIYDGIEEYDWFGEPFEWESRWTDKYRWHKSLLIYNKTLKARLFFLYNALWNKVNFKKQHQFVLRNPRDIKPGTS